MRRAFISGARLRRILAQSPIVLGRKAARRMSRAARGRLQRLLDEHRGSYARSEVGGTIVRHLRAFPLAETKPTADTLLALTGHYLAHRFDLLGSGWVEVRFGTVCRGLEGHRYDEALRASPEIRDRLSPGNVGEASRIAALIEGDYAPIDWQLDFKSGRRWNEFHWYADIPLPDDRPGADIKVPWELARCQHFCQLALAHGLAAAGAPGFRPADEYRREFRNELLDFVANNPPRYGVNWTCAMDVGFRVANWLMAYDCFCAASGRFDPSFESIFKRSVLEHGRHISGNLEWNDAFRSNHYLGDLVGLLYAGAYLPASPETDAWIRFAARELATEIPLQFTPDGANFEASTSYHRLSAEMAVYAIALMTSLLRERLPLPWPARPEDQRFVRLAMAPHSTEEESQLFGKDWINRIERAAEFALHVTREDGSVMQLGDNDSGRLFKLQPACQRAPVREFRDRYQNLADYTGLPDDAEYHHEDTLDHRHLAGAIGALFARSDLLAMAGPFLLDAAVVRMMCNGRQFASYRNGDAPAGAATVRTGTAEDFSRVVTRLRSMPEGRQSYQFRLTRPVATGALEFLAYPDFGLYLFKAAELFLAIHCGPHGQARNGGHAHNDQLGVELVIGKEEIAVDAGSYLYSPLPSRRNEYRSVAAHFAPRVDAREPGDLSVMFSLPDRSNSRCLYFGPLGFIGAHDGYGWPVYRVVTFGRESVEIEDFAEGDALARCEFVTGPDGIARFAGVPFSPGYGSRERR